jgi:hypothetical protein
MELLSSLDICNFFLKQLLNIQTSPFCIVLIQHLCFDFARCFRYLFSNLFQLRGINRTRIYHTKRRNQAHYLTKNKKNFGKLASIIQKSRNNIKYEFTREIRQAAKRQHQFIQISCHNNHPSRGEDHAHDSVHQYSI